MSIIIMETVKMPEDLGQYISNSIRNIDNFINKNEYSKAFGMLILFLERLDGKEKAYVVEYYSKNLRNFGILSAVSPS